MGTYPAGNLSGMGIIGCDVIPGGVQSVIATWTRPRPGFRALAYYLKVKHVLRKRRILTDWPCLTFPMVFFHFLFRTRVPRRCQSLPRVVVLLVLVLGVVVVLVLGVVALVLVLLLLRLHLL